ncbi:ankyrin repeat-containing domain protein [Tricladium varicosporioides]|nr:ankyrin repeat-containing domain protein [Hymenoscyphus varicosporioides]
MAEAATVIQLIQFSGAVLGCCYKYISKAKNAPKEIQRVIDEISSLKGILEHLKPFADSQEGERFDLLRSLNGKNGSFQACSGTLNEVEKSLEALIEASTVRRRLQWPLEAKKIDEALQSLTAHKTNFILALAGDSAASNILVENSIGEVKLSLLEIQAREEKNRILDWLKGTDPTSNYHAALKKKEIGTCEWLLRSENFQKFALGDNQSMWIHGIPGAGKTVLSSAAIEYLSSTSSNHGQHIAFYYFDFNDHDKQTAIGCLQSLAFQFYQQLDVTPSEISTLFQNCKGAAPSLPQLVRALACLCSQHSTYFLVIDALDECKQNDEDEQRLLVLEALRDIRASATGTLNIFVASRPEADIAREMADLCNISLDIQAALVDEDIRLHVRSCLEKDVRLKRWPKNVKEEIEEKLTTEANGMFRWVVCQLSELRKCLKLPNIRKTLTNLPKTLDATYARILNNIPPLYEREMKTVLILLAFSARPVTIKEVAEATTINMETKSFTVDERFPDPYDIMEFCSSLVSLSEIPNDPQNGKTHKLKECRPAEQLLQFAHFSVKEYILSDHAKNNVPEIFLLNQNLGNRYIAQISLIYLLDFSQGEEVSRLDFDEFPFLAYASLYWIAHLAFDGWMENDSIETFTVKFFDINSQNNILKYLGLNESHRYTRLRKKESSRPRGRQNSKETSLLPLFYISYVGLRLVFQNLLSNERRSKTIKGVFGAALATAASDNHEDVVELLLMEGADPNSPYCGKLLRPLYAAVDTGNPRVIKKLLDAGATIDISSRYDGSVLHRAIEKGNLDAIQLLIDYGHDLYAPSRFHGPPLSCSLLKNQIEVVALLVHNDVDVNVPAVGYFNPLNLACSHAGLETVHLLLDCGADFTLKLPGCQALHNAAERGEIDMMQLLLDRGADINGPSAATYGTPLKAAIQSHVAIAFDFMISNGADINFKGSRSMYPVDQAIFSGNLVAAEKLIKSNAKFGDEALEQAVDYHSKEYLAKLLLDGGADPNADHERYGTILQFSALRSSPKVVEWLLEAGSDPNDIPSGEYGTALQAATYRGQKETVQILLKHGASPNLRCSGEFGNPLQAAINHGDEDIVHLLLDAGASVTAQGGRLGTPLQAAASRGLLNIVILLISKGAHVNHVICGEYGTALNAALAGNHAEVVKFLLDQNANLNTNSPAQHSTVDNIFVEEFKFPIEVAASTGNTHLVQLLLEGGFQLNSNEEACARALKRASDILDITMLEYLIANGANVKRCGALALTQNTNRHDPNRIEKIRLLLKHGANPSGDSAAERTPLSASIHEKQTEITDILIESSADVNIPDTSYNGSALHEAIDRTAIDLVEKLIHKGADVNIRAGHWGTPLTLAIINGDERLYKLLLENGACVNTDPPYGYYGTPLHAAISKGYDKYKIAYDLLDRGANPHTPGLHQTVLTTACGHGEIGQLDLVEHLISLGVDVNAEDVKRPEQDGGGGSRLWTPLQFAVYHGLENVAQLLLEHGATINPSPPTGSYGNPLQASVQDRGSAVIKYLLEKGANVNAVGGEFGTALQAAAEESSDSIVKLLLDNGADVKLEGGVYGSPLQASARIGKKIHVELFLALGAPVNTNVGKYGNPLAAAAKRANREVAGILLQHGANSNQEGGKYGTPLQAACCSSGSTAKHEEGSIVKLLLENGANVNAEGVGKYGTALQAAAYHSRKYVEILLEHGADPNARGGKFGSALNAARKKGLGRVEKLLLQHGARDEGI